MRYPRQIAQAAAESARALIADAGGTTREAGDLRMEKPTLERIELIAEGIRGPAATKALTSGGWRKLRTGRGPIVFLIDEWPKLNLCIARPQRRDLIDVVDAGNAEVLLFMRTGTRLFLDDVADRMRDRGLRLKATQGLLRGNVTIATTERDIFAELDLP